jgi:hypothetical protein
MTRKNAQPLLSGRKNILGQIAIDLESEKDYFQSEYNDYYENIQVKPELVQASIKQLEKARIITKVLENIDVTRRYDTHAPPVKNHEERPLDFGTLSMKEIDKITEEDRLKDCNYKLRWNLVQGHTYNPSGSFIVDSKCDRKMTREQYAKRLTKRVQSCVDVIQKGTERISEFKRKSAQDELPKLVEILEEFNNTPYVDSNIPVPKKKYEPKTLTQKQWELYKKENL